MGTPQWLVIAGFCSLSSAMTVLACRWWYRRRLSAVNVRWYKCDKARQFSIQQTLQARRQLDALQKDLSAQQQLMAAGQLAKHRSRHAEEALKAIAAAEEAAPVLQVNHGFADTQPMA